MPTSQRFRSGLIVLVLGLIGATHGVVSAQTRAASPAPVSYFPLGTFPTVRGQPSTRIEWYSRHLATMGEPALASSVSAGEEAIRFLHLPTWGRPFAVRITHSGTQTTLVSVRLSGNGGYDPGHVEVRDRHVISEATWQELRRRVDALRVYELPTDGPTGSVGVDGEQWVLEGVRAGNYHLVDRWMPQTDAATVAYRALCEWIAALAGPVWTGAAGTRR